MWCGQQLRFRTPWLIELAVGPRFFRPAYQGQAGSSEFEQGIKQGGHQIAGSKYLFSYNSEFADVTRMVATGSTWMARFIRGGRREGEPTLCRASSSPGRRVGPWSTGSCRGALPGGYLTRKALHMPTPACTVDLGGLGRSARARHPRGAARAARARDGAASALRRCLVARCGQAAGRVTVGALRTDSEDR